MRHDGTGKIKIHGKNFECYDCSQVRCRFGTDPDFVKVPGELKSEELIECPMPAFPMPDLLPVEVSMNDKDYSNSGQEFGFYDPFVIDVTPKLINKAGGSIIKVKGFGFVDTSED